MLCCCEWEKFISGNCISINWIHLDARRSAFEPEVLPPLVLLLVIPNRLQKVVYELFFMCIPAQDYTHYKCTQENFGVVCDCNGGINYASGELQQRGRPLPG